MSPGERGSFVPPAGLRGGLRQGPPPGVFLIPCNELSAPGRSRAGTEPRFTTGGGAGTRVGLRAGQGRAGRASPGFPSGERERAPAPAPGAKWTRAAPRGEGRAS